MSHQITSGELPTEGQTKPARRWLWLLIAIGVLVGVLLFLSDAEDSVDVQRVTAPPPLQPVSVEVRPVGAETVEIRSFAEVRPRWSAELRSAVSGRVLDVMDEALVGERVEAGTTLITIEASRYVAELNAAELALEEA